MSTKACIPAMLCALAALAFAGPLPVMAANWPESYHDAGHTGFNPSESALSRKNISGLQLLWGNTTAVSGAVNLALFGGTIYVQGGGNGSQLAAIDAASGATLWSVANGNGSEAALNAIAFGQNLVFVGCGFNDNGGTAYGTVCAYRKDNGKLAWKYASGCNCGTELFISAPPVYSGNALYFGYYSGGPYGTERFAKVDAKTGATIWIYNTGDTNGIQPGVPVVDGGYVYFSCSGNNGSFEGVCALSQSDGSPVWSVNFGVEGWGLTAHAGRVYATVAALSELVALDGASGTQVWSYTSPEQPQENGDFPPAFANGTLYMRGTDYNVYAVRASDGTLRWSGAPQSASTPSIANGVLYVDGGVARQDGQPAVLAYNIKTGRFLWSAPARDFSFLIPPPIVANGTLFLTNAACGSVCAYGLASGTPKR